MYMKAEAISLNQFLQEYRQKKNMEILTKEINRNKRLRDMTAFVLGSLLYVENAIAADKTVEAVNKLNYAGNTILSVVQTIGYWVALIMCVVEILKSLSAGDTKSIGKIIVKYLMAFAGIYVLKWLFDLIRITFGG